MKKVIITNLIPKYINLNNLRRGLFAFRSKKPFPHAIVDNFFNKNIAKKLEMEFPTYKDKNLHEYKNYCEVKKSCNNWNLFPSLTYKIFTILNSKEILELISKKTKIAGCLITVLMVAVGI